MAVTPEEQKNARRKAMLLLEHMDRTEKGLSDRLRQAGFSAEATEDAMNYVRSYGYLNDYRYAMNYISFRMGTKSRQKILAGAFGKGIDRETALGSLGKRLRDSRVSRSNCAILRNDSRERVPAWYCPGREGDAPPPGISPSKRFFLWRYFPRAGRHEYYL